MTERRNITKEDVLLKTRLISEGARFDVKGPLQWGVGDPFVGPVVIFKDRNMLISYVPTGQVCIIFVSLSMTWMLRPKNSRKMEAKSYSCTRLPSLSPSRESPTWRSQDLASSLSLDKNLPSKAGGSKIGHMTFLLKTMV